MSVNEFDNDPAFPNKGDGPRWDGLTKREYFAAKAMGPLEKSLSEKGELISAEEFARRCIKVADAFIAELAKKAGEP